MRGVEHNLSCVPGLNVARFYSREPKYLVAECVPGMGCAFRPPAPTGTFSGLAFNSLLGVHCDFSYVCENIFILCVYNNLGVLSSRNNE